jgi:hypothetical protein
VTAGRKHCSSRHEGSLLAIFVTLFGLTSHECRDAPDASSLPEDLVLSMIERYKGCGVDTGDVASLLALELIASIAAYDRAPLPVILAAIAEAARTREALLRDANQPRRQPARRAAAAIECRQATAIAPDACLLH